jgi:hypothetical protein
LHFECQILAKERGEIASKKAWEYGKTGFKDVSERNPKIGEKKRPSCDFLNPMISFLFSNLWISL